MTDIETYLLGSILVGTGATLAFDVWMIVRDKALGIPPPNWAVFGRWLAGLPKLRLYRPDIGSAPPVRGENVLGWGAHYAIGIVFAGALLGLFGIDWLHNPEVEQALLVGIGSVAAPFLVLQPAMGQGVAGANTPQPWKSRLHSLLNHGVFGLGLFAAGALLQPIFSPA